MNLAKRSRREFLKILATVLGAEALPRNVYASAAAAQSTSSREVIEAAGYGVSTGAPAAQNTSALLKIRASMQASDSAFDLILPDGRLNILTGRWLQGVKDVRVRGGKGTQLRNVAVAASTTERVPLVINQDYFLNRAGSVPGWGEFVNGDRIRSVRSGASTIRLLNADDSKHYLPGTPVLIYGYNQDSQGYPPSIRYFERHVVVQVGAGVIELARPLQYDYDARWADIVQNADAVNLLDGKDCATGAARVLSLDRPGFCVARNIELDDLEFVSSRDQHADDDVTSLDGSLYAFSADRIVCNRVRVNGYFYPSASGSIVVNDSYIRFVENDKLVDRIEYNRCEIGFFSNGPAVNRIVVNDSTIEEPIPIISCRAVEFNDVTFLGQRHRASAFVTLSFSTPMDSVVFNRPRLASSPDGVLPLTTGGGVVSVRLVAVKGNTLYAAFTGVNDPVPRGLAVGSVLRDEAGEPQFDVTGIWLENGMTAIGASARSGVTAARTNQTLFANICKKLAIVDPQVIGMSAEAQARFASPRSGPSNASLDIAILLNADDARILDTHHNDSMIAGTFDFDATTEQYTFDVTINRRARQLVISVDGSDGAAVPANGATVVLSGLDHEGHTVWQSSIDLSAAGTRTLGDGQLTRIASDKVQPLPDERIVRLRARCTGCRPGATRRVNFKVLF